MNQATIRRFTVCALSFLASTLPLLAQSNPGSISGTVTAAATGEPKQFVRIRGLDNQGTLIQQEASTDSEGRFTVKGLAAGTYFVLAEAFEFESQFYDGIRCPLFSCVGVFGTPVVVSAGATTTGIDFALQRLSPITGTVRDAATGLPLSGVELFVVRDPESNVFALPVTDASGRFTTFRLPPGNYFAKVNSRDLYLSQVFQGMTCGPLSCDETTGTVITVGLDEIVSNIDFDLDLGGKVSGFLTDAATAEPVNAPVDIFDADGAFVDRRFAGVAFGRYGIHLAAGTYFVVTASTEYHNEVYDDLPCPSGACDPTLGKPVVVTPGVVLEAIDFVLDPIVAPTCVPSSTVLCLNDNRFRVEARWRDFIGQTRYGEGVELTDDTGTFWFFNPSNLELMVKILDACQLPGFHNFWVFAGGLTDVEVTLRVTDTETLETREWFNPLGTAFEPIRETAAFMTCP